MITSTGTVVKVTLKNFLSLLLMVFLCGFGSSLHAQTNFTSNVVTGNWNTAASWTQTGTVDGDGIPDLGDNVTIANGHTISINANAACVDLILNGSGTINFNTNTRTLAVGGTLTMNGTSQIIASADNVSRVLNVTGNFSVPAGATNARIGNATASPTVNITGTTDISGTFSLLANPRIRTFIGNVSVSGSWTSTALTTAASLVFRNGITTSGTFTAGAATFNTNTQSIGGSGTMSFANPVAINANTELTGSVAISFANTVTVGAATTLTNNNTNTVTMSNTGVALASGGAGSTFTQGTTGNTLSYAGSSIGVTTFNATGSNNTVNYTGATPTIFATNYHHLTYSGSTTGTTVNIGVAGNLSVSSGAFTSSGTVTFNGSSTQTLSGAGTFTFANLTMNTSSAANVLINRSITINGTLNFNASGLLVVDGNSEITISQTGQITNFNASSYIQLDGGTGAASQLIKATSAATTGATSWEIVYPIGTATGGYTPMDLTSGTADVAGANPTAGATMAVKAIYNNSIQGQLRRTFRVIIAGNGNATTFAFPRFNYHTTLDLSSGDDLTNYTSIWFLNSTGAWVNGLAGTAPGGGTFIVNAPTHNLSNGSYYYTIGAASAYPNTWYSYETGVWSDWRNWTLDPSGTTLNNALKLPPQPGDEIVILTGNNITNDVSGQLVSSTTIQSSAILDMAATTGNTLGTVKGTGLLRVAGVTAGTMALPTGTYNNFVAAGTGGTIEYYDNTGNLPLPTQSPAVTTAFYNNLFLSNSTGAAVTVTTVDNLTVRGNFTITTTGAGTAGWQINDLTNTQRTIILNGDLTVGSGGRISVGGSNANNTSGNEDSLIPHSLTMYGNFTNNGVVKFFFEDTELVESDYGLTYPTVGVDLHRNELQGNAVTVTFSGTTDKTVTCNNKTDFYRLVLDKGTGQQAVLTVNSSNTANLRLFGPADIATVESGGTANYVSSNALSIVNGTLELKGSINIPVLQINTSTTGYFPIPRNGALWLNGPNVTVQITDMSPDIFTGTKDGRILISGLLRITDGTLFDGFSKGLGSQDGGSYLQEGGTVSCWQFRPRSVAGDPPFSFTQTGGTLNVGYGYAPSGGKIDQYEEDYARFDLRSANSTFQMSGNAVLNVAKPTSDVDAGIDGGLFLVASTPSNISVTGGTVNLYAGVERSALQSYPAFINSTASFYNLNIYEESATTEATELRTNSLVVLNNLTINTGNTPSFVTNNLNVTVGGNFIINAGTTYTAGTGITTFNGSGAQNWTNDGTITSPLTNVVINKSSGTLTLGGSTHTTFINAAGTGTITNLTLTSGTLADNGKILTITGALSNSATHSGSGGIIYSNGAASTIGGNNGTFGNLTITSSFAHSLSGAQTVTGDLRLTNTNTTLNIGANALRVFGNIYSDASPGTAVAFGNTKRILTNGMTNAGGLTRQAADATDLLFPVGSSGIAYTPVTINVDVNNSGGTVGTITVRPVNAVHPNVTTAAQSVRYYWRVTSSGFDQITAVNHKSYVYSTATRDAAAAGTYRAARFDADAFTWATSNTTYNANAGAGTTTIAQGAAPYAFNTASAWTGISGVPATKLDGEYTAGNLAAFGTIKVFYSRQSGPWIESSTWSNTAVGGVADVPVGNTTAGTHYPAANSPVVIGDGTLANGHTVTTGAAARSCGRLTLDTLATLDCGTVTGHNFGTNASGAIGGRGRLRIGATGVAVAAMFPAGDFTDFVGPNGGTVEWYGNSKTIPTAGPSTNLATYYNLVLNPSAGNTITLPGQNLTVYNDLTQGDQATFTGTATTNGARTITITRDLNITRGTFGFSNVAASATAMTVSRNTTIGTGASFGVVTGGTANANTFTTPGNITNNGTIRFRDTGTVDITFTGSASTTFGGTGSVAAAPNGTTLNFITVNKGSSQSPSVTFNVGGTVTAANTNVIGGWLRLVNGTFIFATTGTHSIITRNNGDANDTYTIASTSKLQVNSGTVNVLSTANDFADLLLNGTLEVAGGTVNIAGGTSGNDIEYASAGTPSIVVSSGALNVNGSIRRSTSTLTGALVYNQTNGAVTVRGYSSDDSRGVFEIDANPGSSFTLVGTSTLTVQRQTDGTGYADVFINPVTSNVSATSTIAVGLTTATTQTNLRVNIAPAIGNFTVLGPGANANQQTVNLFSNPMVLGGNLTITTPSVLNTNSLDVSIAGNLVIAGTGTGAGAGTYTGGTNTTTFNGTVPQVANLTAVSTFNNMTINNTGGATVTLSGTAPSLTNLNILSGVLDVGSLGLNVNGNIINNSSQISTPGTGSVILAGTATSHTITSSNGSFHNLTFGGSAATKTVSLSGNLTVNGALNFATTSRYFNIGSSRLTLGSAASILGAGTSAFIKTNGVSSDLGVVKTWPVGNDLDFTYSVGTRTNYTPVTFTDLDITTGGTLTVIPVDEQHPTASADGSEILNYYWIVQRNNTLVNVTSAGTHEYQFPTSLIGGSIAGLRVGAYLDPSTLVTGSSGWVYGGTFPTPGPPTTVLRFTTTSLNFPGANGEYHYSVGTTTTLQNPIGPIYSRFGPTISGPFTTVGNLTIGGDWDEVSSWTNSSTGYGSEVLSVPNGRPVYILPGARINMINAGGACHSFGATINGLLVATSAGHSLNTINGTGTLRTSTSTLPAGTYTNFVAAGGGTIEYVGTINMSGLRPVYNNLNIGNATTIGNITTVVDFALNGNLNIASTSTLNNATNNHSISVAGNLNNSGTVSQGTGTFTVSGGVANTGTYNQSSAIINVGGNWSNTGTHNVGTGTVNFNGANAQSISGTNSFYNLGVSKSANNLTLNASTTVTNVLTLTSGHIVTTAANPLILTSTASSNAGSANSFVSGPMLKTFNGSFTFPVGSVSANRYRPATVSATSGSDTWTVQYVGNNPSAQGYTNISFNTAAPANLGKVSEFEYWNVSRLGATTAALELTYNTGSYVVNATNIGNVANLKVVRWDAGASQWDVPPGGGTFTQTGNDVTGTVKVSFVTNFSPFTFGSTDGDSPLPINLLAFEARLNNAQVDLTWKTAQENNNHYFVIEKTSDLETFKEVGRMDGHGTSKEEHKYFMIDWSPSYGRSYYRLKQVDFDGKYTYSPVRMIDYEGPQFATLKAYPNPYGTKDENLVIEIDGLREAGDVPLQILNSHGQVIFEKVYKVTVPGEFTETVTLPNRPSSGVYILKAGSTLHLTKKIVIE